MRSNAATIVVLTGLVAAGWASSRAPALSAQAPVRPAGWTALTHGPNQAPDYTRLFSLDRVHEITITIAADEFGRMRDDLALVLPFGPAMLGALGNPNGGGGGPGIFSGGLHLTSRDPSYFHATVHHDGRVWPLVGIRYKGNFSLMMSSIMPDSQLSFRLNFDRFEDDHPEVANQRFYGFKELTFSANFSDPSHLREALANEIFRDRGVPAPRVAFYRVMVDTGSGPGEWGLYTMVEDPADEAMLNAQFGGAGGNLYKPDGPGADWTRFDAAGFEKKTNKSQANFRDVEAAIAALHADRPAAEWRAELEKHLDVDLFLRWLAVNQVVDNWDSYGRFAHNYYLYAAPNRGGRLAWIPWDNNFSFGLAPFGLGALAGLSAGAPGAPGQMPGLPMVFSNQDVLFEQVGSSWPLLTKLLADPTYRARYRAHLRAGLDGLAARPAFEARVRAWQALVAPTLTREGAPRSEGVGFPPVPFRDAIDGPQGLMAAGERRRAFIEAALAK